MIEAKKAIKKLKVLLVKHKESHISWQKFLLANPDQEEKYNKNAGGIKHQEKCIREYDEALQALEVINQQVLAEPQQSTTYRCPKCGRFYKEEVICNYCQDVMVVSARKQPGQKILIDYLCHSRVKERVKWHLEVPVCRILRGLKIHLATISLSERWQLCYYLKCSSVEGLCKTMWAMIKARNEV